MLESQGGREKAREWQDSGPLEDESGGESSGGVSEVGETQGLGLRLQQGGLGW